MTHDALSPIANPGSILRSAGPPPDCPGSGGAPAPSAAPPPPAPPAGEPAPAKPSPVRKFLAGLAFLAVVGVVIL
jgi:hypothetical protein